MRIRTEDHWGKPVFYCRYHHTAVEREFAVCPRCDAEAHARAKEIEAHENTRVLQLAAELDEHAAMYGLT